MHPAPEGHFSRGLPAGDKILNLHSDPF